MSWSKCCVRKLSSHSRRPSSYLLTTTTKMTTANDCDRYTGVAAGGSEGGVIPPLKIFACRKVFFRNLLLKIPNFGAIWAQH